MQAAISFSAASLVSIEYGQNSSQLISPAFRYGGLTRSSGA